MKNKLPWILLSLIILTSFSLMLYSSKGESAIMDELAHIPAGYSYDRYLDYRLNPEHPPLLKALSALPLLFQSASWRISFPTDKASWQTDINGQWTSGTQFLYESGNDADKIIEWSRLAPMLLTLLLIFLIYIWAKELIGKNWALLPAFLFGLSPTVLAHGHYVTTDLAAAFGIFASSYFFVKYLFYPSRKHLIWAGLFFGIAQLLKFSAVLLIPFFGILVIIFAVWKAKNEQLCKFWKIFFKKLGALILIFAIGYILVWIVYGIFTFNYPVEKQVGDTQSTLFSFGNRSLAELDIKMASNGITRPIAQYMLGVLMVMQRSSGGNTAYFLGEISAGGWWYYFPVVFILKEPIPSLILILLALVLGIWAILKNKNCTLHAFNDYLGTHFAEFSMIVFVAFYWAYSIRSPLNIGIRHILPTLPFIYILTAGALKKWSEKGMVFSYFKKSAVLVLAVWFLTETLIAAPNFISYFNRFGGGTENGYMKVVDSNYDWGQDLKRLASWMDKNLPVDKQIAVDYFGGGNPQYYLGDKNVYWQPSKGNPLADGIQWFAVSINNLQGALGAGEYSWLKKPSTGSSQVPEPYAKAGTSIFIYKLY